MTETLDAKEIARQVAEQTAQQIGESVSQAISKVLQSQTMTSGMSSTQERMGDIGGTERIEKESMDDSGVLFSNQKRTYDEYQHESLETMKRLRGYAEKILSDAQIHDNAKQNVANQALQNAVETANMVSKQAVRHGDIAIDRQWNVDEQGYTAADIIKAISGDTTAQSALKELVVAAVAEALNKKE